MPTRIEYATDTLELTSGCTPVSEGCEHCWARRLAEGRLKRFYPGGFNKVAVQPERLYLPLRWRKPRMVFVCSRSDLFHPGVPFAFIRDVFTRMMCCDGTGTGPWRAPYHVFLLLTKRPERMLEFALEHNIYYLSGKLRPWPFHAWPGVSVENQRRADERLPLLAQVPAEMRWVSLEPLLGPVNVEPWLEWLKWVVIGGESGPGYRPMDIAWLEKVVTDCREAGVPVWVKQASSSRPGQQGDIPDDLWQIKEWPELVTRCGII